MARTIEPERWERYYGLFSKGHSRTDAARRAGVSLNAVRRFEAGDPSSSGNAWIAWRRAIRQGIVEECPTCGRPTSRR